MQQKKSAFVIERQKQKNRLLWLKKSTMANYIHFFLNSNWSMESNINDIERYGD